MTEEGTDHAELDAAAEEVAEAEDTPTEEVIPQEEVPEEPEDNAERSNLGRRVKSMEDNVNEIAKNVSAFIQEGIKSREVQPEEKSIDQVLQEKYGEDYIPTTASEFNAWANDRDVLIEDRRVKSENKYQGSYRSELDKLGQDTTPEEHKAIVDIMMKDFNIKRSDSGVSDAHINYKDAQVSYLRGMVSKNPLEKNKGKESENLGGALGTSSDSGKSVKPIVLDKYAQAFADSVGMSEEDRQKALNR